MNIINSINSCTNKSTLVSSTVSCPLDNLSSSAQTALRGAFSIRRLYTSYTSPIIIVRRSSDSNTVSFYSDNVGNLGTSLNGTGTSLSSWLGGSTGYITQWYDQSGKGNHATQSNTSAQPTVMSTVPQVYFDGSTYRYINMPDSTFPTGSFSFIFKHFTVTNGVPIIVDGTVGNMTYFQMGSNYQCIKFGGTTVTGGTYAANNVVSWIFNSSNSVVSLYTNNTFISSTGFSHSPPSTPQYINRYGNSNFGTGYWYTYLIFNTYLGDSDRVIAQNAT